MYREAASLRIGGLCGGGRRGGVRGFRGRRGRKICAPSSPDRSNAEAAKIRFAIPFIKLAVVAV
jgi:hypothetical protein